MGYQSEEVAFGVDVYHLRLVCSLLLAYPLAYVLPTLRLPLHSRHAYSFVVGFALLSWATSLQDSFFLLLIGGAVYAACSLTRLSPFVCIAALIGHYMLHYGTQTTGKEAVLAGAHMSMIVRWSLLTSDVYDGKEKLPDPIAYLGYLFFFPTLFTGPGVHFEEYRLLMLVAQIKPSSYQLKNAFKILITSLVYLALHLRYAHLLDPAFFTSTTFQNYSFLYK